jgi:multidrug efflux system membrane fusion protein
MRTLTISFAISLLFLAGCGPSEQKKQVDSSPVRVRIQPVQSVEYKIPVRATGLLSTTTEMKLSFKTGGIIKQISAKEGRPVHRGDVLAVLDLSEVKAQVNQARIGLEKAERDLNRAQNLYRDSVATLEQYQNARSAFEMARSQKKIADFNLQHSQINAPSDGKIQKILVETNEVIGPGFPAILFASTENDWVVRAALTDKDVVKFTMGDSARIYMDAFPDAAFKAEVTELGTVADPVTGTYEVELLILRSHPQFRTGFISRVEIFPTQVIHSLVVPIEALMDASDQKAHVFVYQEGDQGQQGRAQKRNLKIGHILGSNVVVHEGIEEGELIITEGAKYLRADMEVYPVNQPEVNQPEANHP